MTPREARSALDLLDRIHYCEVKAFLRAATPANRARWLDREKAARDKLTAILEVYLYPKGLAQ